MINWEHAKKGATVVLDENGIEYRPITETNLRYWISKNGEIVDTEPSKYHFRKFKKLGGVHTLSTRVLNHGYRVVSIRYGKKFLNKTIHSLLAETFIGKENGKFVNHIDGNKLNNSLENLEYVYPRENINHHRSNGRVLPSGVYKKNDKNYSKKFAACFSIKGKTINLGYYLTPEEAHKAYMNAITPRGENKYATCGTYTDDPENPDPTIEVVK